MFLLIQAILLEIRRRQQNAKASYSYCASNDFTPAGPSRQFKRTKHSEVPICYPQYSFLFQSFWMLVLGSKETWMHRQGRGGEGWGWFFLHLQRELLFPVAANSLPAESQAPQKASIKWLLTECWQAHLHLQTVLQCVCTRAGVVLAVRKPWWKYSSNNEKLPFS